jgi:rSAM/selenodomain-associated transferase 2
MAEYMQLSVIIPTLNEEQNIAELLSLLKVGLRNTTYEIIVVDANSVDQTRQVASNLGAIVLSCSRKCRAHQMNDGVAIAKGDILYFVHADSRPPNGFLNDIFQALDEGFDMGCFRFRFDSKKIVLKINSYFTRIDFEVCRGGDQTLFIKRKEFNIMGGYNPNYRIMEEYDFMRKVRKQLKFKIIPKDVVVSARKYEENSYFRVNLANFIVFNLYKGGASQEKLISTYKSMLNHRKPEALI